MTKRTLPPSAMARGPEEKGLPTFAEFGKQTQHEEAVISRLLQTKDGAVLLTHLARVYDGSLVAKVEGRGVDEFQTAINIGAREVVHHLRGLANRRTTNGEVP